MEKRIKLLKQYARDNGSSIRTENDLGPLELWLINKISVTQPAPVSKITKRFMREYMIRTHNLLPDTKLEQEYWDKGMTPRLTEMFINAVKY